MVNFLLIGNGAREHAIAKKICEDDDVKLFCFMSAKNPGIVEIVEKTGGEFKIGDIHDGKQISAWADGKKIDLAFPSPDAVLAAGVVDVLEEAGIRCAAPTKNASRLEWDKDFTRELMQEHSIEGCPRFKTFHSEEGISDFVNELGGEVAIKPCGLTGGKGVKVVGFQLKDGAEAVAYAKEVLNESIGSGLGVIVEQRLVGQEFSLMAFCDGKTVVPMPMVQDHKRAYENDEGPNTGGMGSYSDHTRVLPFLKQEDYDEALKIMEKIEGVMWQEKNHPYVGIMYGGFIATKKGVYVIEINSRFGDPEAMNVLSVLRTPLYGVLLDMADGRLKKDLLWEDRATVVKYLVPKGYPGNSVEPAPITIDEKKLGEAELFYGSVSEKDGMIYSGRSRSIAVLGKADDIYEAQRVARRGCDAVRGELWYREDIGTEELISVRFEHMKKLRG